MNTVKSKQIGSYPVIIAIALALIFLIWSTNMFAGKQPTNLGVRDGQLTACPSSPNCVNSQAAASDVAHAIAPIQFGGDSAATMADLKMVIRSMPRTSIVKQANDYLYVEFASKLMGFVDDVEFYFDPSSKNIQVRSASRLGESDLGVNRQRIEEIRSALAKLN
jgi:uncharacterized protein (DUF1499 family)